VIIVPIWMSFSPISCVEGCIFSLTDTIEGGSTITHEDNYIFLGSALKNDDLLSGTVSFSGNQYTTATIEDLVGGNIYVFAAIVTIDGEVVVRKCEIICQKIYEKM
jgi:hypothetical protein